MCVFSDLSTSTVGVSGMFDKTLVFMTITNLSNSLVVKNSPSSSVENSIIRRVGSCGSFCK